MKRWMLLFPLLPLLAGCFQDTASHSLGARDHAITLVRNQSFFWQSTIDLSVIITRMPVCNGGGGIKGLPEDSSFVLYKAPDEYPEPLMLLKIGERIFALSDQSCRLQEFEQAPDSLGEKLGTFRVEDDKFQFITGDGPAVGEG
ncbi:MAG: hypothetical protein H6935_09785 [Thiobacillus sp.]|nr:hypothetical protein [Thiobacillus sp.]